MSPIEIKARANIIISGQTSARSSKKVQVFQYSRYLNDRANLSLKIRDTQFIYKQIIVVLQQPATVCTFYKGVYCGSDSFFCVLLFCLWVQPQPDWDLWQTQKPNCGRP
jgi:hypothetical protein